MRGLSSLARVKGSVQLWDLDGFRWLNSLIEIGGDLGISHCGFGALSGLAKLTENTVRKRFERVQVRGTVWRVASPESGCATR